MKSFLTVVLFFISYLVHAEEPINTSPKPVSPCTIQSEIKGVVGPATVDLMKRVHDYAKQENCTSILLTVDTPGGSLQSTRMIVSQILNSPIPYLCIVSPSGGHAGSAGAIILLACHVNGGIRGTNLGAATPVSMGKDLDKDLRQKIMNDTRSWVEGLTKLRGRSEKFGQDIILEAKAVTSEEALKLKAIDFVGDSLAEFQTFASNREVKLDENKTAKVELGPIRVFELDARHKTLSILTDPEFAYMMLLGSLALLYFEFTHPGVMLPGVIGGLGLVVSMVALHKLDVEYGGLLLIFLGIAMLIAEMFIPSFGFIGIGGIVAFTLGSIFLFDPVKNWGYTLPLRLILPVGVMIGAIFLGVSFLMLKTIRVKKLGGFEDMMGVRGHVSAIEGDGSEGSVELRGEIWKYESTQKLSLNDSIIVTDHKGLILKVERERKS